MYKFCILVRVAALFLSRYIKRFPHFSKVHHFLSLIFKALLFRFSPQMWISIHHTTNNLLKFKFYVSEILVKQQKMKSNSNHHLGGSKLWVKKKHMTTAPYESIYWLIWHRTLCLRKTFIEQFISLDLISVNESYVLLLYRDALETALWESSNRDQTFMTILFISLKW